MREPTTNPPVAATGPDGFDPDEGCEPLPELPDLRDPHDWPGPDRTGEFPAPTEPGRDDD